MLITESTPDAPGKTVRKVTALVVAFLVHLALAVGALLIVINTQKKPEPEIVAKVVSTPVVKQPEMQKKAVIKQLKQATSATAASPIASMIRANTTARIFAPEVTKVSDGPLGLGEGDFGSGFGRATGGGMGSGATFFGMKSGRDLIIVIDISGSMVMGGNSRKTYDTLEQEAIKAINALNSSSRFNIITFARESYAFKTRMITASPIEKRNAIEWIKSYSPCLLIPRGEDAGDSDLWFTAKGERHRGTASGMALKHAFEMNPRSIIFVSDGEPTDESGSTILKRVEAMQSERPGTVKISAIAYRAGGGMNFMEKLAEENGGEFKNIK